MKKEAIAFIGAHPDDTEGFAGAAFLLREKYEIHVIDLTRGELGLGMPGLLDGSTAARRVKEESAACAFLGATPHFLAEIDGDAYAAKPSVDMLAEILCSIRPRAVFTHWPVDEHQDHVQTAAVVIHALKRLDYTPERYFYEVLFSQTRNFKPLYHIDISSTIGLKADLLRKYECQNVNDALALEKVEQARIRGQEAIPPVAAAETFTTFDGNPIEGGVLDSLVKSTFRLKPQPYFSKGKFPKITSPSRISIRPGKTFLYNLTYTAPIPLEPKLIGYAGKPLCEGFALNAENGILSITFRECGDYAATIILVDPDKPDAIVTWHDIFANVSSVRQTPSSFSKEVIYQLEPRTFSANPKLSEIEQELPRLKELGVDWVYFTSIFEADRDEDHYYWSPRQCSCGEDNPANPYRNSNFRKIDPDYGTNDDFKKFVASAHGLGLKVMLDIVFFHCGPSAKIIKDNPDWVDYDAEGKMVRNNWSFPRLNISTKPELRKYLIDTLVFWVNEFGVDGYRMDCGDDVPLDFWEEARDVLDTVRPGIIMLDEGVNPRACIKAFDCLYGFGMNDSIINAMKRTIPPSAIRDHWLHELAEGPGGILNLRKFESHDIANNSGENRLEKVCGPQMCELALALIFCLDGIPFIFNGQEIGWNQKTSIFGPHPIDWAAAPRPSRASFIRQLSDMRKNTPALTEGSVVWRESPSPDDIIIFDRLLEDGSGVRCVFDFLKVKWQIDKVEA